MAVYQVDSILMNSGLPLNEHMFAFQKSCLHHTRATLSDQELKSAATFMLLPSSQITDLQRGRLQMRLLFQDCNIGFPLVLFDI